MPVGLVASKHLGSIKTVAQYVEEVNSQNAQAKEKFSLKETDWHTAMTEEEASEYNRKNINPNGGSPYYNDRSYRGYSKSGALSAHAELSAQYPGLLSSDIINPSAQLQEIADTLDAVQWERFGKQKKKLRQELRNKYKTELISQQTEAKAQAQLKQTEKNLARAKKQAEKDAIKARMTDYRNRMNALNKSQTTSSKKAPILSGDRRTEK